jgi:hypothetical protein
MIARSPVLAFNIVLVALTFSDDVVFLPVLFGGFPECRFGLDFSAEQLAPQLEVPVLSHFLRFGEALFPRCAASVLPR